MLMFARTETTTPQQDIFSFTDATLFLSGRLRFRLRPMDSRARAEQHRAPCLAYGQNSVEALRNYESPGRFV
jgi:hypothetical protein